MRERVGPYRLLRRLGRGGMGEVWLADSQIRGGFGKRVALKLIALDTTTPDSAFLREAQLSLLLSHSNIVTMFDAGVEDDLGYLAMEWVEGIDLAHLLAFETVLGQRGLPEPVATFVVAQMCRGLAYAHELCHEQKPLHVVHRDVSASNVLISRAGEVKITDFGIARSSLAATSGAAVKGKLRYMAPEQFAGQPMDARADLYAVGVTLHEMLVGEPLRRGESAAAIVAEIAARDVPAIAQPIASETETLRRWLLAPDPAHRPASASQVLEFMRRHALDRDASRELAELCTRLMGGAKRSPDAPTSVDATKDGVQTLAAQTTRTSVGPAEPVTRTSPTISVPRRSRGRVVALVAMGGCVAAGVVLAGMLALRGRGDPPETADVPAELEPLPVVQESQPSKPQTTAKTPVASNDAVVQADGWPSERVVIDSCPIDADEDGVHDVVAMWRLQSGGGRLVVGHGATGRIIDGVDHAHPKDVNLICVGGSTFGLGPPDELQLFTAKDLSAPRRSLPATPGHHGLFRIGDGCISVDLPSRERMHLEAGTLADTNACIAEDGRELHGVFGWYDLPHHAAKNTAVLHRTDDDELEVESFTPSHWRRRIGLMVGTGDAPGFAVASRRIWVVSRPRNKGDGLRLVGLDRGDGRTVAERPAGTGAALLYLVADDVHVLHGTGSGVCSLDPSDGMPRWCRGLW